MKWTRQILWLVVIALAACAGSARADGMVFAPAYFPKVQIPNQQALIQFANGREHLVIETSFLGQGTNFAWIVPLPTVPDIKPVSPDLFDGLRALFAPRLIHPVTRYYLGLLFACGWVFLGWRSLQGEVVWLNDLPLCLLLATAVGFVTKTAVLGALAFLALLYVRVLTRSLTNLSLSTVVCFGCLALAATWKGTAASGLIRTLGDSSRGAVTSAQVSVLARQKAGIFDTTTIKGNNGRAVLEWLDENGFAAPPSAAAVVEQYVRRGWVFVAAKARRADGENTLSALHPLAFTFSATTLIYPLQLTALEDAECAIDLYVFGERRAASRRFSVVRCDRIAASASELRVSRWRTWLRVGVPL